MCIRDRFGYANVMQVPRLVKVVVSTGVGEAARDSKVIEGAIADLVKITGQKPMVTKARKSCLLYTSLRSRSEDRRRWYLEGQGLRRRYEASQLLRCLGIARCTP